MIAPLLIQLAKLFSVVGDGQFRFHGPFAWLHNVRYEFIFCSKLLQQVRYAVLPVPQLDFLQLLRPVVEQLPLPLPLPLQFPDAQP